MINQQKIVNINALPQQTIKPLSAGANNIFESGMIAQQNEANLLNSLNSLRGGIRRHKSRRIKGGAAPVVVVAGASSFDPNPKATNDNNAAIASLANKVMIGSAFDNTTSQAQVAEIASRQQALYSGKGGNRAPSKKKTSNKKGGSIFGCLSGGKNTKKYKKSCRRNRKKHRKTRKIVKRYRH